MARNYKELQAKMNPAHRAENQRRVKEELQRMALEELRSAKQLTQADMAEMLDVPQSSISRIEQRTDMYLSTLRNFIQVMGGILEIRVVSPDGGTVIIDRFGDYEDRPYEVWVQAKTNGTYRLRANPCHNWGQLLYTRVLKTSGFIKVMRALHLPESQISAIRLGLGNASQAKIGGIVGGDRIFSASELVAAGFESASAEAAQ